MVVFLVLCCQIKHLSYRIQLTHNVIFNKVGDVCTEDAIARCTIKHLSYRIHLTHTVIFNKVGDVCTEDAIARCTIKHRSLVNVEHFVSVISR